MVTYNDRIVAKQRRITKATNWPIEIHGNFIISLAIEKFFDILFVLRTARINRRENSIIV